MTMTALMASVTSQDRAIPGSPMFVTLPSSNVQSGVDVAGSGAGVIVQIPRGSKYRSIPIFEAKSFAIAQGSLSASNTNPGVTSSVSGKLVGRLEPYAVINTLV